MNFLANKLIIVCVCLLSSHNSTVQYSRLSQNLISIEIISRLNCFKLEKDPLLRSLLGKKQNTSEGIRDETRESTTIAVVRHCRAMSVHFSGSISNCHKMSHLVKSLVSGWQSVDIVGPLWSWLTDENNYGDGHLKCTSSQRVIQLVCNSS